MGLQAKAITGFTKETTPEQIAAAVQDALNDLADQLNREPALVYSDGSSSPSGLKVGDTVVTVKGTLVAITVKGSQKLLPLTLPDITTLQATVSTNSTNITSLQNAVIQLQSGSVQGTVYKGAITTTTPATFLSAPNDWAFIINAGVLTIQFNQAGTIKKTAALT